MEEQSLLEVKDLRVDSLIPNDANVNEMNEKALNRLVKEIVDVGFIDPIQVIPKGENFQILGGEHRWKAAKIAGLEYVPCVILSDEKWSDNDFTDLVTFKLNAIHGKVNPEKFVKLYERVAKKNSPESIQDAFAVTDDSAWRKLSNNVKNNMKAAGFSKEMIDKVAKVEKSSNSFDQFKKSLNRILKSHTDKMDSSYVVFSRGDKEHVFIKSGSSDLINSLKAICKFAEENEKDINDLLMPKVTEILDEIGLGSSDLNDIT